MTAAGVQPLHCGGCGAFMGYAPPRWGRVMCGEVCAFAELPPVKDEEDRVGLVLTVYQTEGKTLPLETMANMAGLASRQRVHLILNERDLRFPRKPR